MPQSRSAFDRRVARALGSSRITPLPRRTGGPLEWIALANEAIGGSGGRSRRRGAARAGEPGEILGRLARTPESKSYAPLRRLLAASVARAVRETLAEAKRRGLAMPTA